MAQITKRTTKKGTRFTARVFLGRDGDGKRSSESKSFDTLRDAKGWVRDSENAVKRASVPV